MCCGYFERLTSRKQRHSWVIFKGGGAIIPSCQNSILSCQLFFLSGRGQVPQFCSAKLLCQGTLPKCSANGQNCIDMAEKQTKIKEKQEDMAETNQKCYKLSSAKLPVSVLPSFQFCTAKVPFLSCQGPIFVK